VASCGHYQEGSVESRLGSLDVGLGAVMLPLKKMHVPKCCRWKVRTSVSGVKIAIIHRLNRPKSSTREDSPRFLCTPYWTPLAVESRAFQTYASPYREASHSRNAYLIVVRHLISRKSAFPLLLFNLQNPTSGSCVLAHHQQSPSHKFFQLVRFRADA
jgi:hypothetical protein